MRRVLKCDTCGETCETWAEADQHEWRNPDHWVQLVPVETAGD